MMSKLKKVLVNEEGAVTVEWVVLTAAVVGLAVSAYATINSGSGGMASNTDTALSSMQVGDPVIGN